MKRLYGPEMHSVEDYVRYSARFRDVIGPHIEDVMRAGLSVVLDFPANTVATRQWMRGMFENADVAHQLHYLKASTLFVERACMCVTLAASTSSL